MGGPGKGVFRRSGLQTSSSNYDFQHCQPIHKGNTYYRLQDDEDHQEQEHETMESFSPHVRNHYEEEQEEFEHEVNFLETETHTSNLQRDENISSTSHGTTITRKESRALAETRKSRPKKGNLVFEVDEFAGRIVGEDSQLFITKGGCVMREHAKFDGTTWRVQPTLLKADIIAKCTENSNYDPNCRSMVNSIQTQLGSQHRNKQFMLHKYYNTFLTKEEAITHPPRSIKVPDWVNLCERFASEDFQKISIRNKKNKSFNEIPPALGTVSIARVVDKGLKDQVGRR